MVRPYKKINMAWSGQLAYVIGIITTDGNLSIDERHINITSKDKEIVENCKLALVIDNKIGKKSRDGSTEKNYYTLQFGSVLFYNFLLEIGLYPAKSKILKNIAIPKKYFADFLRGCMDGDGSIVVFKHPESKNDQIRLTIASASEDFLIWIKKCIFEYTKITGGWISDNRKYNKNVLVLSYGKKDTIKLLKYVYNTQCEYRLTRKYNIMRMSLNLT